MTNSHVTQGGMHYKCGKKICTNITLAREQNMSMHDTERDQDMGDMYK